MRYYLLLFMVVGMNTKSLAQSSFFTVNPGSSIIVNNATIKVGGTITSSGNFDVTNGTLDLYGLPMQIIPAGTFANNTIKNLVIRNAVTLAGPDTVTGTLSFGKGNTTLVTGGHLTLKSTASGTARVADVTNRGLISGNTIVGDVTVERYIPARKAWHFLSVPTNTSQTIKETWQEGAINTSSDPVSRYGTQITSNRSTWFADGFDLYSAGGPSMKMFDTATNTWIGITNTHTATIKSTEGYMTFIRGDRTANAFNSVPTETTLRTKAELYIGDQNPINVGAGKFASIGNPFASDLDMRRIITTGLKEFFIVWDPNLGGNYGYGAYQTFSYNGSDYVITPGMGSYDSSGSVSNYIHNGQAFFVQGDVGGGSLTFNENAKVDSSQSYSARTFPKPQLRANLYGVNKDHSTYMTDGLLINYDDSYSNNVDDMDAIKSTNSSENLSIKTSNKLLVIERRHSIVQNDTIFLNLANTKVQQYRFEFKVDQLDKLGLKGFLEDSYLKTSTALNLTGPTLLDFNIVNIAGSYAPDRFRVVFKQHVVLPVTYTSIKAYRQTSNINIEWKVENEINIRQYEVEKSTNGTQFTKLFLTSASGNGNSSASYLVADTHPVEGYNYYRIKSIDLAGEIKYTNVVKVLMGKGKHEITIYPNPVVDGVISVQLNNMPAGNYTVNLFNNLGQEVLDKIIQHTEGSSTELINIDKKLTHGIYQLVVTKPGGDKMNFSVVY